MNNRESLAMPAGLNKIFGLVVGVVVLIVVLFFAGNVVENLDASDQMVIQYPNGVLETFTTPGWKPQWFGRVTKYKKRTNYDFLAPDRSKNKDAIDHSIEVRFNDAGHGRISGSIAYENPTEKNAFLRLHTLYGSQQAVEEKLVSPVVNKAVYMTGPLMSSRESYAERRNELLSLVDDQIQHGVYRTRTIQRKEPDPITGQEKSVQVVQIVQDSSGHAARQDHSPLEEFGIKTFNLAINGVLYDESVENQIKQQQQMVMDVQTSMVEAKKAEQAAITAEQNGKAAAAKAKWDQEVVKATEVTAAEKRLAVAELDARAAEQYKRKQILEGEGDATKKRLVMQADGALDPKLKTWLEAQKAWATAFQNYPGQLVPSVVWGGGGSGMSSAPASGAQVFMEMMGMKAAKDLGLDMTMPKGTTSGGK